MHIPPSHLSHRHPQRQKEPQTNWWTYKQVHLHTLCIRIRVLLTTPHEDSRERPRRVSLVPCIAPPTHFPFIGRIQAERQTTGRCVRQPHVAVKIKSEVCASFVADNGCCVSEVIMAWKALEGESVCGCGLVVEECRGRDGGCRSGGLGGYRWCCGGPGGEGQLFGMPWMIRGLGLLTRSTVPNSSSW
jgi:hypothetical protein